MNISFLLFSRRSFCMGLLTGIFGIFSKPLALLAASKAGDPLWSKTNSDWRKELSSDAYRVLREEGTEPPFSSSLNNEKRDGLFLCAGCKQPLFSSTTKFDSGTGWPSFGDPLQDAIDTKVDYKLIVPRTEYHCRRCGGHQGHVFNDGPRHTGKRYCNNGIALLFKPQS